MDRAEILIRAKTFIDLSTMPSNEGYEIQQENYQQTLEGKFVEIFNGNEFAL